MFEFTETQSLTVALEWEPQRQIRKHNKKTQWKMRFVLFALQGYHCYHLIFPPPVQRSSDRVHGDTEQVLSELLCSLERLQELLEEVLDQASVEKMGQAQEVADRLEAEIRERRRRDTDMKDLGRCEDHIHYLQVGGILSQC